MDELQSLKNPQRIVTLCTFLAVFITSVGPEALGQALPFIPQAVFTGVVTACTWYITQATVEKRVVRAEVLKEDEFKNANFESDLDGCEG